MKTAIIVNVVAFGMCAASLALNIVTPNIVMACIMAGFTVLNFGLFLYNLSKL